MRTNFQSSKLSGEFLNDNKYLDEFKKEEREKLKTTLKDGETYVNGFDFYQRVQKWMYTLGVFNYIPEV